MSGAKGRRSSDSLPASTTRRAGYFCPMTGGNQPTTCPGRTRRLGLCPVLAACGGDGDASPTTARPALRAPDALTSTADVQVGGCSFFAEQEVVMTQPTKGDFKGFTAVCTHAGCLVGRGPTTRSTPVPQQRVLPRGRLAW